ncbi:MAG: carboxypeptidase-like regulatory domain-containing protein [Marinilabiliaceae bacterium]|nr:carboxypeptidase-like regulatory domain-containing protein [Marinilabiliaceae bacterium]
MKAFTLIVALFLTVATGNYATGKKECSKIENPCLSGIITDAQTGETLVGVEVCIEGTDFKTYTNFDGEFVFEGLKPGSYKIQTNYVSYKSSDLKLVTVKSNEVHLLTVKLKAQNELDTALNIANEKIKNDIDFVQYAKK